MLRSVTGAEVESALELPDELSYEYRSMLFRQLTEAIANPKPIQKPHPPIWIGGSGPKRTLRVVARHADVWNGGGEGPDETKELLRILDEHCAKVGRDRAQIRLSRTMRIDDADAALKQLEWSKALGYTDDQAFTDYLKMLLRLQDAGAKLTFASGRS